MSIKKWLLFSMALVLILSSADVMSLPAGKKIEDDIPVRVTIQNDSDKPAYLKLTGPHHYYFVVGPNSKSVYTPLSGKYDYLIVACGVHYKEGKIELYKNTTYIVPQCGLNAYGQPYGKKGIDVGRELKLIRMTFKGKAFGTMVLVLRGPSTYVISLPKDENREVTIRRGWYEYTLYGCGRTEGGKFYADRGKHKTFYCP
jgi:hypothetical protein